MESFLCGARAFGWYTVVMCFLLCLVTLQKSYQRGEWESPPLALPLIGLGLLWVLLQ